MPISGHSMKRAAALLAVAFFAGPVLADSKAAVEEIRARMRNGDLDGAIAIGERETRLSPNDSNLWGALGEAYGSKAAKASVFSQFGLAKKCKAAFETAVRVDPRNVDAREDLFTYYVQAPGIAGGSIALAREQAAEILKLDAGRGHVALATLARHDKNDKLAEAELKLAIEAAPTSPAPRMGLASLLVDQKRYTEAKQLWRGLVGNPEFEMPARYQLAKTCLVSGTDLEEAVDQLKLYLTKKPPPDQPPWAAAQWRLGQLYEKLGRKPDAVAAWKESLRLDPGFEQAKQELKRVGG